MGLEKFRLAGEKETFRNEYVNIDVICSELRRNRRRRFDSNEITNPRIARDSFPVEIPKTK